MHSFLSFLRRDEMQITIKLRSGKPSKSFPLSLEVQSSTTLASLKELIQSKSKVRSPSPLYRLGN